MTLTKYEHACFVLEEQGERLVVDPGDLSLSFDADTPGVTAIVITHVHADHMDERTVKQLLSTNPEARLFTTNETAAKYPKLPCTVVHPGDMRDIGPFHLEFFGGQHAVIYPDRPAFENVGVVVNDTVAFPGDSFDSPGRAVPTLLAPAAAPWLKINEAVDYIAQAGAQTIIPTHDAILSDEGKQIHDAHLSAAAKEADARYVRLEAGKSLNM